MNIPDFSPAEMAPAINANEESPANRPPPELDRRAAEERMRVLLDMLPMSAWLLDPHGTIIETNDHGAAALCSTVCRLIGVRPYELLPPALAATLSLQVERAVQTGQAGEFDYWQGEDYTRYFLYPIHDAHARVHQVAVYSRDITARQKTEEALRQSLAQLEAERNRWETMVESIADGVAVCDSEGRLTYLKPAYERPLSRTVRPDLAPEAYPEHYGLYHPDGTAFVTEDLPLQRAVLTGQVVRDVEIVSSAADGSSRTALWSAAPFRDATGRPAGAVATGRDITDLKRAKEELARSNAELEQMVEERTASLAERAALLELSFDAILVRDSQDRIQYFNRGAEELYGWQRTEIHGRVSHELFQTRFPEPLAQIREKLQRDGRWAGELIHRRRDGSVLTVATRWVLKTDDAGNTIGTLETNTDITDRKRTEEALRRREQELTVFFEEAPLGLLWVKLDGGILRANRAALELFGCADQEIQSCHIAEFNANPDGTDELLQRLATGETVSNYRWRLLPRQGSLHHVLIDANGLWQYGRLSYSRWFVRDITRRVELEQEILAVTERERRRLGHDLHDDLCQQLTGIEFLSQSLATSLTKRSREGAAKAKEIATMVRLVMVETRAIARGLSPLSLEADGLMIALQELATHTEKLFGRRCHFVCPVPVLLPDPTVGVHVYRIAQEAVGNAIKHSHAQQIEIHLLAQGQDLLMEVSDNGDGLPLVAERPMGMGLRIMKYRAESIDGSLTVQTNPAGGTRVACVARNALRSHMKGNRNETER